MARPLTDQESEVFDRILSADGIGLVQTSYSGQETAVIAEFATDAEGNVTGVTPLAVLLTDEMFAALDDPFATGSDSQPMLPFESAGPDDGGFFDYSASCACDPDDCQHRREYDGPAGDLEKAWEHRS